MPPHQACRVAETLPHRRPRARRIQPPCVRVRVAVGVRSGADRGMQSQPCPALPSSLGGKLACAPSGPLLANIRGPWCADTRSARGATEGGMWVQRCLPCAWLVAGRQVLLEARAGHFSFKRVLRRLLALLSLVTVCSVLKLTSPYSVFFS